MTRYITPSRDGCVCGCPSDQYDGHVCEEYSLIVLNNDTVACESCNDDGVRPAQTPDTDAGLWPMGRVTEGVCSSCGYRLPVADPKQEA